MEAFRIMQTFKAIDWGLSIFISITSIEYGIQCQSCRQNCVNASFKVRDELPFLSIFLVRPKSLAKTWQYLE